MDCRLTEWILSQKFNRKDSRLGVPISKPDMRYLPVELAPLDAPAEQPPGALVVDMRTLSRITRPVPGATLLASTETFSWSEGAGVSAYWLEAGTTPGGTQIFSGKPMTERSGTVSGLPTNGSTVYIRLWSLKRSGWQCNDYTYIAAMTPTG